MLPPARECRIRYRHTVQRAAIGPKLTRRQGGQIRVSRRREPQATPDAHLRPAGAGNQEGPREGRQRRERALALDWRRPGGRARGGPGCESFLCRRRRTNRKWRAKGRHRRPDAQPMSQAHAHTGRHRPDTTPTPRPLPSTRTQAGQTAAPRTSQTEDGRTNRQ